MAAADTNQHTIVDRTEEAALPTEAQYKAPTTSCRVRATYEHGACPMNEHQSFSDLIYGAQTQLAERELSSFVSAVTKLYGAEQARLSAQDWFDEFELIDSPPLSTERNWRAVTIAASARLADRLNAAQN